MALTRLRSLAMASVAVPLVLLTVACGAEESAPLTDATAINPLYGPSRLHTTAPDSFRVRMVTSEGDVVLRVKREWAPIGVDRFYTLVTNDFYNDQRIYRVIDGWVAQWGFHADGLVNSAWMDETILDDPPVISNSRGTMAFAKAGPNSRTTAVFISYADHPELDSQGFAPFAVVESGMEVVDAFYSGYGEGPPQGDGPYQRAALAKGNQYLDEEFPLLTRIESMEVIQ